YYIRMQSNSTVSASQLRIPGMLSLNTAFSMRIANGLSQIVRFGVCALYGTLRTVETFSALIEGEWEITSDTPVASFSRGCCSVAFRRLTFDPLRISAYALKSLHRDFTISALDCCLFTL
uniref:Uncharacterized protein n=1 Tax=Parascaris univalens TaxID=6257 RepID=A0A915ATX7_PARUN